MSDNNRSRFWAIFFGIILVIVLIFSIKHADGSGDIPEEVATPCVWISSADECGTPTAPTPVYDELDVYQLPNTGAGTTAREIRSSNHSYTTTQLWCTWQWGFTYPTLVIRTNYWQDNWWGPGHHVAYYNDYHQWWTRCYYS